MMLVWFVLTTKLVGKNMGPLPSNIEKCPIAEAIFEVRYSSEYPDDAIFGVLYAAVQSFFTPKPAPLAILQLPEAVRERDPNLKYQPYHRLLNENLSLGIGPRVLTFANSHPYKGWEAWSNFFYDVLSAIEETKALNKVERVGLRYINVFDGNIFDKIKLEVNINDQKLTDESTNLRTEIIDDKWIKVLQVGNAIAIEKEGKIQNGSVIDIDCLYNIDDEDFFSSHREIIETGHVKEKELFFSLLKQSFLDTLKPTFEE